MGTVQDEEMAGHAQRALKAFTSNPNKQVEDGKIDPVIGRTEELESIRLSLDVDKRTTFISR